MTITIIPNGVNQEKFNKIQQVDLKINEGHFTFGYFGALANYEGIDDLLYALSDLKKMAIYLILFSQEMDPLKMKYLS